MKLHLSFQCGVALKEQLTRVIGKNFAQMNKMITGEMYVDSCVERDYFLPNHKQVSETINFI